MKGREEVPALSYLLNHSCAHLQHIAGLRHAHAGLHECLQRHNGGALRRMNANNTCNGSLCTFGPYLAAWDAACQKTGLGALVDIYSFGLRQGQTFLTES